jgi:acetyltransferase-like isoleucine patch superfamily enzyme
LKSWIRSILTKISFNKERNASKKKLELVNKNLLAITKNGNPVVDQTSIVQNSEIGQYSYISPYSIIDSTQIGKFCSIGPHVVIGYGDHPVNFISTSPMFYYDKLIFERTFNKELIYDHHKKVIIENDVWIGANVYIKNGLKIGNGAIIAAGAVVIKDVPDYAIVGGVPASILKYRFKSSIIEKLLRFKWWDLETDVLDRFSSGWNRDLEEDQLDSLMDSISNFTH